MTREEFEKLLAEVMRKYRDQILAHVANSQLDMAMDSHNCMLGAQALAATLRKVFERDEA